MEYEFIVTKVRRASLILPIFPIIMGKKEYNYLVVSDSYDLLNLIMGNYLRIY